MLAQGDDEALGEAMEDLAAGDLDELRYCITLLDRIPSESTLSALRDLMKDRPEAIGALIEALESEPLTPRGGTAGYLLGTIGYFQRRSHDPRIIPALIRGVERNLKAAPGQLDRLLRALQEAALSAPDANAEEVARRLLDAAKEGTPVEYDLAIDSACLILWAADRRAAEAELLHRIEQLPVGHWLNHELRMELEALRRTAPSHG